MGVSATSAEPQASSAEAARRWRRALETVAEATRDPERILPSAVEDWALKYKSSPALIGRSEQFSFAELAGRMNRYARWALSAGVKKGDSVALIMSNRPEYVAIWLGLTRIGAIVALVAPTLSASGVAHAMKVAGARRLIVAAPWADLGLEAAALLGGSVEIWTHGGSESSLPRIDLAVVDQSASPLASAERPTITLADRALRIFTSGTTGLPKAAEVSHRRLILWSHWFAGLCGLTSSDRLYNCLPMHHSVGGVVAVGAPLVFGGSVAIAERFSVQGFWDDVARWNCTAFQYIGEFCRYLAAAPARPEDGSHGLRLGIGNGLSGDVWRAFHERFGPVQLVEFYASTEGNVWLYNVEGRVGSIGRVPSYLALRNPIALVRFDYDSQMPARGPTGFCEHCADGETGEALGRIGYDPGASFDGYTEDDETRKKILRDVFRPGDAWMRTGDLMRRDAEGFYTFVDRIGDTFRWKGENVSTLEVETHLRACPGVQEALVYGVSVPDTDGRAGMALLTTNSGFSLQALSTRVETLPKWARPLFVRIAPHIEATETFKPKRAAYVQEGFDPRRIKDALFVFDAVRQAYVALDQDYHDAIRHGRVRV